MTRKVELCYMSLSGCGLIDRIRVAAEAGFDRIGLRLVPVSAVDVVEPILSDARLRRETIDTMRAAGISPGSAEFVLLQKDTDIAALEPMLACAAELGADQILVLGGDLDLSQLTPRFGALCNLASQYGIKPQLEFAVWMQVPDLAAARQVVEGCGSPGGGVLIDALHVHRAGVSLEAITATPPDRIHSLQLCDAAKSYDPDWEAMKAIARRGRLPPGDGELDLVDLIRAVPDHAIIGAEIPNEALQSQLGNERFAKSIFDKTMALIEQAEAYS